ncbi:hypothetical protein FRY74_06380 [Vicingus serpentipes]|uniref:Uncharacterized protein n=1 Tax=Vicingus serpentipes TaxID=1926625 RepID=A0A5C6RUL7_9FLAO|nr:hypothetical protein [Vicingus serpentipes]TXB66196.1 hypothetical protein FRY74_06380 [Vicingus serpentipes]
MNKKEQSKIKSLIKKYNPILNESVEIALTEDLFNLIIVNGDDKDFELKNLLKDKQGLKSFVIKEFIKLNQKPITKDLKNMDEIKLSLIKTKQERLKF